MHIEKFQSGGAAAMLNHYDRTHVTDNVDRSRSVFNYYLSEGGAEGARARYAAAEQEVFASGTPRRDAVHLCDCIVTLPKGDEVLAAGFFEAMYDCCRQTFGAEREVGAVVHYDENGQPHMHYHFVPTVREDGKTKLAAKRLLTREFLSRFHDEAQSFLKTRGINIQIVAPDKSERATASLPMEKWQSMRDAELRANDYEARCTALQMEIEGLEARKKELQGDVREGELLHRLVSNGRGAEGLIIKDKKDTAVVSKDTLYRLYSAAQAADEAKAAVRAEREKQQGAKAQDQEIWELRAIKKDAPAAFERARHIAHAVRYGFCMSEKDYNEEKVAAKAKAVRTAQEERKKGVPNKGKDNQWQR